VDFHDLRVILRGVKTKTALFTMRLSYSGRAAHRASLSQGQEAFMESHVHAFERLGGVPLEQIRYDNLRPAVSRVLFGRGRVESAGSCPSQRAGRAAAGTQLLPAGQFGGPAG
jgi:transposase